MIDRYEEDANHLTAHVDWQLDADLWGGVRTLREAGRRVLPQLPAESDANYEKRLYSSYVEEAYPQAIRGLAGRLRESMIRPVETVAESISQWFWAQDFDDVLYELDIDGLRRGHTFAAVE